MDQIQYRALVVDDESLVRQLTMRALACKGFCCDPAVDGLAAQELLEETRYDVVVTDLRMPRQHGHSLAVALLARDNRPAIVVLTGVAEPKLANDLIVRGVDDVMFKPVDYEFLALKVRALVERRHEVMDNHRTELAKSGQPGKFAAEGPDGRGAGSDSASARMDIDGKLAHLSKILPVSQAAFDVFGMASSSDYDSQQIAAAIARDPSLSVDVLRLANSSFCNASGNKVIELEDAVVRIGQKRIGELALATSALAALTANVLPWMDVGLAWRRSVAAGVAADLLLASRKASPDDSGIFLSTIMHPLGRIALGMLFPQQYREMVEECSNHNTTLVEQERRLFPLSHGQVMSRLLEVWNIPVAAHEALRYVADDYASIGRLRDPLRRKVELMKLAILIGRIAVGQWEPWDRVEFPPAATLERLAIGSLSEVIEATKRDSEDIISFRIETPGSKSKNEGNRKRNAATGQVVYFSLSNEPCDFLAEIVTSMGINLRKTDGEGLTPEDNALINCIGAAPYRIAPHINPRFNEGTKLIVSESGNSETYTRYGEALSLPSSFKVLAEACRQLAAPFAMPRSGQRPTEEVAEPCQFNVLG